MTVMPSTHNLILITHLRILFQEVALMEAQETLVENLDGLSLPHLDKKLLIFTQLILHFNK